MSQGAPCQGQGKGDRAPEGWGHGSGDHPGKVREGVALPPHHPTPLQPCRASGGPLRWVVLLRAQREQVAG